MKFKQYIRERKQSQIWLWRWLRPSDHWHAHLNVLTLDSNSDSLKWQLVVEYYETVHYYYFCKPVTDEQTIICANDMLEMKNKRGLICLRFNIRTNENILYNV